MNLKKDFHKILKSNYALNTNIILVIFFIGIYFLVNNLYPKELAININVKLILPTYVTLQFFINRLVFYKNIVNIKDEIIFTSVNITIIGYIRYIYPTYKNILGPIEEYIPQIIKIGIVPAMIITGAIGLFLKIKKEQARSAL